MRDRLPQFVQRMLLLSAASRALGAGRPAAALELLDDERLEESARAGRLRRQARERLASDPSSAFPVQRNTLLKRRDDTPPPSRFQLAVDTAGDYVVVWGGEMVLGHSRAGAADIPLLADVAPEHARLRYRGGGFHGGPSWTIEPVEDCRVLVGGEPVEPEGRGLAEGDEIELAPGLCFRWRVPDPASDSALLSTQARLDYPEAQAILLLAPGPSGRVRIGNQWNHHVCVAASPAPVELVLSDGRLQALCALELTLTGGGAEQIGSELALELPPRDCHFLQVGRPGPGAAPFGMTIAPLETP